MKLDHRALGRKQHASSAACLHTGLQRGYNLTACLRDELERDCLQMTCLCSWPWGTPYAHLQGRQTRESSGQPLL